MPRVVRASDNKHFKFIKDASDLPAEQNEHDTKKLPEIEVLTNRVAVLERLVLSLMNKE